LITKKKFKFFADFELVFGNDVFISLLSNKLKTDSESLSADNVVCVLNMKRIFNIKDIEKGFSFIAQNFVSLSSNE